GAAGWTAPRALEQVLRRRDLQRDRDFGNVWRGQRSVGGRSQRRRRRRQRQRLVHGGQRVGLRRGGSPGSGRGGAPRRADLRGSQLLVPQAADRSCAELRDVDARGHLRVREHLSVHALIWTNITFPSFSSRLWSGRSYFSWSTRETRTRSAGSRIS